ncbi:MAG: ATP phosphoribosyltransferase [Deltaproteobacteria bacterium RIFCSPLOWO2_12_FULL_43_16]|nr:MAG: ATP phosphoribosyltransferase [Deltaproteobacteria bacterium RIFCSPHIGHO2_02_FULL_43_33]OGQ34957.1 MAG: ATP phosphoribosyltransferase [Deltaproteobacteria bacterium RIFCSPLOWO2_01_FULL_42_9]OGQ58843.1 MAG: ATP phosphoribosyltransferase [Deltaproteobacteria bacterium RIFCSPLOWO2_12_FULL_43_16]HBR18194.1 ATP phosphoribosyltransferase [Deltaproteobacteria bacterium]
MKKIRGTGQGARGNNALTIALPKGRILKEAVVLFKKIGIDCSDVTEDSRKLIFENKKDHIRFMVIRSQDVPTYVEYGAADVGIAGKDVLLEQEKDIYEPLDLGIGFCRMVVAEPKELGKKDNPRHWTHIRVATKYPNITLKYFLDKGIQVEIIKLYGSIELAPILGLSERIVDLVATGETMKRNGLVEVEEIMKVTSKLICNRASLKTKPERIRELVDGLKGVV